MGHERKMLIIFTIKHISLLFLIIALCLGSPVSVPYRLLVNLGKIFSIERDVSVSIPHFGVVAPSPFTEIICHLGNTS
jgi:hypothetical protein